MRWIVVAAIAPLLLAAFPLAAQEPAPGTRIRVRGACPTPPECPTIVGTLQDMQGDVLVVRDDRGAEHTLRLPTTATLDVSRRRRGNTLQGLVLGTLVGIGLGALEVQRCENAGEWLCEFAYVYMLPAGAVGGALLGARIKRDDWQPVPRTTALLGPAEGGWRVGFRTSF